MKQKQGKNKKDTLFKLMVLMFSKAIQRLYYYSNSDQDRRKISKSAKGLLKLFIKKGSHHRPPSPPQDKM